MKIFKKIIALSSVIVLLSISSIIPQSVHAATSIFSYQTSPIFSCKEVSPGRYLTTSDISSTGRRVIYQITFGANPTGYLVNIGDSSSNNGGGGDACTQSNDAEIQIVDGTLSIFGSDASGGKLIGSMTNCVPANGTIMLAIYNNHVTYYNFQTDQGISWNDSSLFALDGRPDSEGPVNYTIYGGFNGVVQSNCNRVGSGVIKVDVIH